MEVILENQYIKAVFSSLGAETISIFDKKRSLELLWQGEDGVYTSNSPNLFPFIGRLKNKTYIHEGCEYRMDLHGFAKDSEFHLTEITENSVTFTLTDSPETLKIYPFKFNFSVKYELQHSKLKTEYTVKNNDDKIIYFGVGGHPAFNLPSHEAASGGTDIDGSSLVFEREETPMRILFDPEEILITGEEPYGAFREIPLSKALFTVDALLFKGLKSKYVILRRVDGTALKFWFHACPHLAFWTHKTKGGFICFEPWCGLPDYFEPIRELKNKEGVNSLALRNSFYYCYDIEVVKLCQE